MGIRNRDQEVIERLDSKTLDARFTAEIQQGLNCSPFESEAVLGVVKEVYFPFLSAEAAEPSPGKISLAAVAADEPAVQVRRRLPKANRLPHPPSGHDRRPFVSETRSRWFSPGSNPRPCQQALQGVKELLLTAEDLALSRLLRDPTNDLSRPGKWSGRLNPTS